MLKEQQVETFAQLNELNRLSADAVKKMNSYHAILLAQNDVGRVNLYKLVSLSHLEYFITAPVSPRAFSWKIVKDC